MSSSRGLCLDPDALLKAATANPWVVELPQACRAQEAVERAKARNIEAVATHWDTDTGEPLIVALPLLENASEVRERWEVFRRGDPPPIEVDTVPGSKPIADWSEFEYLLEG